MDKMSRLNQPMNPLLSVIIPVYNGERFLAEAVASVRAQNYAPLEIIIVDDGSTDGTPDVVAGLGNDIRYVSQPNAGPAAARNRGLELARGEIIAFQDADDVWPDGKLTQQLALLKQTPEAQVVLGYTQSVGLDMDGTLTPLPGDWGNPRLMPHLQAALFRRGVFAQVGRFDESLRCGEDLDWYLRALEQNISIVTHPDVVLLYRRHETNLTRSWDIKTQLLRAIKRSLDRRKKENPQGKELLANFIAVQRMQNDKF